LQVPWPVSILLDRSAEDKYNEIFRFIFKAKRAIWVLEQLRFQGNAAIILSLFEGNVEYRSTEL